MEGLIPFVYKVIVQYKRAPITGSWFDESPSASYMRLPGDSGRLQAPDIELFRTHNIFSSSTPSSLVPTASTSQLLSATAQSPLSCTTSRRLVS
ncbi:hypothetical protein IFM89_003628 [Coptis chinensis]|uniref:Uncharacterized protein n=1 Tax=Coptis chinensis TaxID=261450 RepID=A0A835H169_9MAGN|nr:hypothetical protein IFM89_003628 [Coptis chinensis]